MRDKIINGMVTIYIAGMNEGAKLAMGQKPASETEILNHVLDLVDNFIYASEYSKLELLKGNDEGEKKWI